MCKLSTEMRSVSAKIPTLIPIASVQHHSLCPRGVARSYNLVSLCIVTSESADAIEHSWDATTKAAFSLFKSVTLCCGEECGCCEMICEQARMLRIGICFDQLTARGTTFRLINHQVIIRNKFFLSQRRSSAQTPRCSKPQVSEIFGTFPRFSDS